MKPILVTGIHRSGTTWIGRMLEHSGRVRYLYEPFNALHQACPCGTVFPHAYTYVCSDNEALFLGHLRHVLGLTALPRPRPGAPPDLRPWAERAREPLRRLRDRALGIRPLLKDPIAFFSAPWLAQRFGARVVVVVRHPAAFVDSARRRGWGFAFAELLDQPLLMRDVLEPWRGEMEVFRTHRPQHMVVEDARLWRIIYHVARAARAAHPDWIFVRHEDLSADPQAGFARLFGQLGLPYTPRAQRQVEEFSRAGNPVDGDVRRNSLKRDSRANMHKWRQNLSPEEVRLVREETGDVATAFYGDDEW